MKKTALVISLALFSAFSVGTATHQFNFEPKKETFSFDANTPLLKQNNPASLRFYGQNWHGSIAKKGHKYDHFDTPTNGLRAFLRCVFVSSYFGTKQISTIDEYTKIYGCAGEHYAIKLSKLVGQGRSTDLEEFFKEDQNIKKFAKAVCLLENGKQAEYLCDKLFDQAWELAKENL
jgi:hypothetical protein